MKRILCVEDEAHIREFVVINLRRAGYNVFEAGSAEEALEIYEREGGDIDIALLDIMLPGMDGVTLCRRLRTDNDKMGIILLTAKTQEMDKVGGLMMGADDYITKPFSPSELLARIDVLHRRVVMAEHKPTTFSEEMTSGKFTLNLRNRTLVADDNVIELTQVEFQIMEFFFENPGKALERADILRQVWGENYYGEEKIVDVNIRRLRTKIEEDSSTPRHIVTVWGLGYKWEV